MSQDNENNKPQIIMGGVSGNKVLKVRRVHKKAEQTETAEPKAEAAVKKTAAAKTPAADASKTAEPQAEKKTAATAATKPKAAAKTTAAKTTATKAAPAASEKKAAPSPAPEVKAETAAPVAAPKKEEAKPKVSSAVIAMPDSKTYTPPKRPVAGTTVTGRYQRENREGSTYQRNGDRRPGQGKPNFQNNRNGGGNQGFMKDKDEDEKRPMPRKAVKPKTDSPIDEGKKSRANFAERNAFDKKRTENTDNKRENGRSSTQSDRRSKNMNDVNSYKGRGSDVLSEDYEGYTYGSRKKKQMKQPKGAPVQAPVIQQITNIQLPPFITVKEFAEGIGKKSGDVIMELMKLGVIATINQELDFDTACLLADSFGITAEPITEVTEEEILFDEGEDKEEDLKPRPPVVVVMGHVDHGKTSLLDRIRSASVVAGEAGGITQHIGAYTVRLKGRQITFLDTPGHEAFTTMRARGAQVTDIAILVVAADDGVMPQTIEAINHAKAANTEIIVAINKIDKAGANPDKVKQELSNYELIPEEWGGSTIMVPVSAKQGTGIDDLLEMVLLTADILELKADPKRQAKGTVIEAKLDKARGPVATVLVQRGTLKAGDTVVCGPMIGNVRAMYDDKGSDIKKAGPSIPVEILGLPEVPEAGETLYAVTDDKIARQLVEKRKIKLREQQLHKSSKMSLDTLAASLAAGDVKDLNLIVKADVQGSVEAVIQSLEKLSNDEVRVKVIHGGVGAINESDVVLADVSNAIIIGFNVRPNAIITEKAKEAGVDIRLYSVIYNAIEDVEKAMKGMLAPTFEEVVLGHVEIRELFKVSGVGTIGGCYVLDGKIARNCEVRVVRDDIVVYTGKLASLQRMKDAVKEVNAGYECGLSIEKYNDIKIGDIIEAYEMQEVAR